MAVQECINYHANIYFSQIALGGLFEHKESGYKGKLPTWGLVTRILHNKAVSGRFATEGTILSVLLNDMEIILVRAAA